MISSDIGKRGFNCEDVVEERHTGCYLAHDKIQIAQSRLWYILGGKKVNMSDVVSSEVSIALSGTSSQTTIKYNPACSRELSVVACCLRVAQSVSVSISVSFILSQSLPTSRCVPDSRSM